MGSLLIGPAHAKRFSVPDLNLSFSSTSYASNWSQPTAGAATPGWSASQQSDSSSYPSFSETLASVQTADDQNAPATPPPASVAPATPAPAPAASAQPVNQPAHSETAAPAKPGKSPADTRPVQGATTATDPSTSQSLPAESNAAKKSTNGGDQNGSTSNSDKTVTVKPGPAKTVTSVDHQSAQDNQSVKEDVYLSDSSKQVMTDDVMQHPAPTDKTSDTPAMPVVSSAKSKAGKVPATAADPASPGSGHAINPNAPVSNGSSIAVPAAVPAATSGAAAAPAPPAVESEAVPVTSDNVLTLNTRMIGKGRNQNADLAFAVKVQGKGTGASGAAAKAQTAQSNIGSDEATDSFSGQLDSLVTAAGQKEDGKHGSSDGASEHDAAAGTAILPVSDGAGTVTLPAKATPETASGTSAAVTEIAPENAAAAPNLKTVQVQLTGADNQRIDLRMLEKDGNLTISVRTSDGSLTKALQQQLPELGKQLDEQQVRAEWWTPELQKITAAQKSNEASNDGGSNSNSSASDHRGGDGGNRGQQGGRGTPQPDWVEELANPRKSNQNGKQFAWHL